MRIVIGIAAAALAATIITGSSARLAAPDSTSSSNATAGTAGQGAAYVPFDPDTAPTVNLSPTSQSVKAGDLYFETAVVHDMDDFLHTTDPQGIVALDNAGDIAIAKQDNPVPGQSPPCASTTSVAPQSPSGTDPWTWVWTLKANTFDTYPTTGVDVYTAQDMSGGSFIAVNDNWSNTFEVPVTVNKPGGGNTGSTGG